MKRKGFTLTEIAVAAALLVALLLVLTQLFTLASTYINFGMTKLDQTSSLRLAVEMLKNDTREAGSDITVTDAGSTLRIGSFATAAGLPVYDKDGMPKHGEYVEYRYQAADKASVPGILYRNGRALLNDVMKVEFELNRDTINDAQLVRVIARIEQHSQKGEPVKTVLHLAPRHLASWVRDPFWASVSNDRRFKYQFGTEP